MFETSIVHHGEDRAVTRIDLELHLPQSTDTLLERSITLAIRCRHANRLGLRSDQLREAQ